MSKKLILILTFLTMGVWVVGCIPSFYGTAQIEPGFHMDAGGAFGYMVPFYKPMGVRADFEARYGLNRFLQVDARSGLGLGRGVLADIGVGVQAAVPIGPLTPAFHIGISYWLQDMEDEFFHYSTVAPAFLLGIGRNEWITLGLRYHKLSIGDSFTDGFVVVHIPRTRFSVFLGYGTDFDADAGIGSVGVGYKIK